MAVTMTAHNPAGADTTSLTTYVTASYTPTANRLQLLSVMYTKSTGMAEPTSVTGCGLTWIKVASATYNSAATPASTIIVYRAMGAAPSAGTISITFGAGQNGCAWSLAEFAGIDTSGTDGSGAIVQFATNSVDLALPFTVTLPAFSSADNATFGAFGFQAPAAPTSIGAGFTQVHETGFATPNQRILTQWRADNDTTVDFTTSSAGGSDTGGVAIEIKALPSIGTLTAELWENGSFKQSLGTAIVAADGVVAFSWDAATLTALSGTNVELRLSSDIDMDVGSVEWNAATVIVTAQIKPAIATFAYGTHAIAGAYLPVTAATFVESWGFIQI